MHGFSVEDINSRLQSARIRIRVLQRGNALYLQGTFPPKVGESKNRQRQIALGFPPSIDGLRRSEAKAFECASQLIMGTFKWADWERIPGKANDVWIVKYAIAEFKRHYQSTHSLSDKSWKRFWWVPALSKLPQDAELSPAIVLATVMTIPQNTWTRRQACDKLQKLCQWARIEVDLKPYRGTVKRRDISPPTREEVEQHYELIKNPKWKRIYARIAIFGLRPHEAFFFERRGADEGYVTEGKTGPRTVLAVRPDLLKKWEIDGEIPTLSWKTYQDLGARVGEYYRRHLGHQPYAYRHAAAIEYSVVRGAPLKVAALQFGHSEEIHLTTYTKWLSAANIREAYDRVMRDD